MAEILLRNSIYIREFNSRTNIILDIVLDSNVMVLGYMCSHWRVKIAIFPHTVNTPIISDLWDETDYADFIR